MATRTRETRRVPRRQRGGILVAAVVTAGLMGTAFALGRINSRSSAAPAQSPVVGEFDTVKLPVPMEFVPAGVPVKTIRLKMVAFPKHQVPPGALTATDSIQEAYTIAPLPANLPLFPVNFSSTTEVSNPVLGRIGPGMRAMTVRVDATSAVEGWAGSGSVVDVLLVEKDRTVVVAEKVKVLSAERSVSPVEGNAAPNVPSTVTLLVTQEQCLAINTAIPLGKIAFALRSARDEEAWNDPIYTKERLKSGPQGNNLDAKERSTVNGYATIKNGPTQRAYALTNGKWIKTEGVPEGFRIDAGE